MDFLNLPNTDTRVVAVDTVDGMWIDCICGTRKNMRVGRPFTAGYFNDHIVTVDHQKRMAMTQAKMELDAKVKANDPSLTEKERSRHKVDSRTQTPLQAFFERKPKPTKSVATASTASTIIDNTTSPASTIINNTTSPSLSEPESSSIIPSPQARPSKKAMCYQQQSGTSNLW
jgi:hypothetical protein